MNARDAKQRAHAASLAKVGGVDARRISLQKQIAGIKTALNQPHLSAEHRNRLLAGKAELAAELARLGKPDEGEKLRERLSEIEDQLENAHGLTAEKMLNLLAEHSQLLEDVQSLG